VRGLHTKRPRAPASEDPLEQAGETIRLTDEQDDDNYSEQHAFDIDEHAVVEDCRKVEPLDDARQNDRCQHDEGCAEEIPEEAGRSADQDDEQDLEGFIEVEGMRVGCAEIGEGKVRRRCRYKRS
jgi:hypothetical protein